MYQVSADFHAAVANGNEQKALLIFPDCVFTDQDIVIENGIEFSDNFNLEEDLSIGQAPSNEISFSLVNRNRLLNNYTFGDFLATLGVWLRSGAYTVNTGENVRVVVGNNTYVGYSSSPYLKRNGAAVSSQPGAGVTSLLAYGGKIYCFCGNNTYKVYSDSNGSDITSSNTLNAFMQNKGQLWAGKGMNYASRILTIYESGQTNIYEFCPLGYFTAERPKAPDVIQIDLVCYDFMQKFEKDMSEISVSYPITVAGLLETICNACLGSGNLITPSPFINGNTYVVSEPQDFENVTAREVLKWIAEAACANARMNRDGKLILDWVRTNTGQSITASGYSEFNPCWYETPAVTKLCCRDTQQTVDDVVGSGDNAYLIQDNPLFKREVEEEDE